MHASPQASHCPAAGLCSLHLFPGRYTATVPIHRVMFSQPFCLGRRCHRRTVGSARARAPSACSPGAAARRAARGQVVRHGVARGTVEERGSAAARTLSVTAGACARGGAFGGPDGPKFHGAARRRGLPEQPLCAWVTLGEKGVLRVVLLVLCVCVALPVVASCVAACVRSCPTVVAQGRWCASRLLPVA